MRQNLAAIRARLEANKALLDELQAKANASGQQNSVLNKTIEQLKVRIEQQDAKISELTQQLESANQQISELNTKVEEGEKNLAQANTELADQKAETVAAENLANRVYYAIGTNKELKKNGLLEKKFLGRTKVMEGDFNQNYFTVGDKRTLSVIPTGSKKAEIKTNMPEGSYEIVGGKDENKSIRILNPTKFWSLSPYLIIQVD